MEVFNSNGLSSDTIWKGGKIIVALGTIIVAVADIIKNSKK